MSRGKRGGAHLEKNLAPKKSASNPERTAPTSHRRAVQPKPEGLSRKRKIILIVAVALAAAVVLGFLVKSGIDQLYHKDGLLGGLPSVPSYGDTVTDPDGQVGPIRSQEDSTRKEEFYTFLLVGRDTGGGGNTDTIMLCAYDIPNQKLTLMSIPRDTLVDARHPDRNKKINGVWNLGLYYAKKGSEKKGIDYLKEAVGEMMGFTPDFYVIVNWEAFGRLVDTIGGVDFEVPFEMKYKDPTQNLVIDQAAGHRHLSGDDAMQVVRWRHNNSFSVQYADADLGRIRTQQALLKEIIAKCLRLENVTKINEFAEIFTEEVETDLTVGNLLAFAQRALFGGLDTDNLIFTTMPLSSATGGGYVQADPEPLLGVLNESLNPYVKDLEMQDLHIYRYSSSRGYYVYQGTGTGTAPTYSDVKPAQAVTQSTPTPASPEPPQDEPSQRPSASPSPSPSGGGETPPPSPEPPERDPEPTVVPGDPPPAVEPTRNPLDMGIPLD